MDITTFVTLPSSSNIFLKMQRFFKYRAVPNWTTLRTFGNLKIFKTFYFWIIFVPLCAKFFGDVNEKVSIKFLDYHWHLTLGLPFSWQLFYFSSVSIGLAMLLFSARCPEIIRNYSTYTHFNDAGKTRYQVREYFIGYINIEKIDFDLKYRTALFLNEFTGYKNSQAEIDQCKTKKDLVRLVFENNVATGKNMDSFWFVQDSINTSNLISRMLCTLLFLVGFILMTILFGQNFKYVLDIIMK